MKLCVSTAKQNFVLWWIEFVDKHIWLYVMIGQNRKYSMQPDWLSLQRVGFGWWLSDVEACHCNELNYRYSELEIRYSETFTRRSEWSLSCDNVMYDVNVEFLCWYVNVCLVRIDSYDDEIYIVHIGTFAQAYTCDITNANLICDMMLKYWVTFEMNWLIAMPRRWVARDWVAWQTRSARLGHQVMQGHDIGLLGPTCWVISV